MNEIILISCGTTLFFGTILVILFGFFAYLRYLRYKETVALAEKGLVRPAPNGNGKGTLAWGIVLAALGAALCMGLYPLGWTMTRGEFPLNFGPWMLLGLIPAFFGLALILIYLLNNRNKEAETSNKPSLESSSEDENRALDFSFPGADEK